MGKKTHWLGRNRQYRLVSVMAEDALGALWWAENAFLSQPVTARVVSGALGSDPDFVSRFRTTMDTVSRNLSHPNAAAVFNYNWGDDGPIQFVVMEAVEGDTLAHRMVRSQGLDPARSIRIAAQVVDAVEAAHGAGIIHGGLTPKTVVLSAQDHVKVLDFGVAAAAWDRPAQLLAVDDGYVPPEWVLGAKWRPSWDVYSAATLLHYMLTGTPELPDWAREASTNGSNGPIAPTQAEARALFPGLPRDAAEIWCRGLAGNPRWRPSSSELAAALRTAIGS